MPPRAALFLFSLAAALLISQSALAAEEEKWEMRPAAAPPAARLVLAETRRRLGSFQICALCTCCGGPRGVCLPSPCCYAINCNIPNRPFGFCSFTPKSCNCLECSL
ncbi:ubiquitin carboxyl-terminal hydrolase [Wolffia australiana]